MNAPAEHGGSVIPLGVVVTADMIYALVLATRDEVKELTIRVGDLADHEQRIRHLERWQWRVAGGAAAIGAIAGGGTAAALAAIAGGG